MARDMTTGNISRHMMLYALPLLFGNLFQQLYHTVDSFVVSHYNGKEALASIGAAGPIMNILLFLIVGISMGTSILMAEFFGAKKMEDLKSELSTALVSGGLFTLLLSAAAFFLADFLISLTNTPKEISHFAAGYLKIVIAGLLFSFLYNILSAALRAIGDSKFPLIVLVVTTCLNIGLDILFVGYLDLSIYGAALATLISQVVSAILTILYIKFRVPMLALTLKELRIERSLLKKTIDFSSISAIQQTFLYVGRILVQSGVNTLGVDGIAAFNAASIIDNYILAPGDSLASSLTTFTAQNQGAGKRERLAKGLKNMLVIAFVYIFLAALLILTQAGFLMRLFLEDNEQTALSMGVEYLTFMALFYVLTTFCQSFQGYFRGIGKLKITLIATFVQIPIRVVLSYTFIPYMGLKAVALGVGVGWIFMTLYEFYAYYQHRQTGRTTV